MNRDNSSEPKTRTMSATEPSRLVQLVKRYEQTGSEKVLSEIRAMVADRVQRSDTRKRG